MTGGLWQLGLAVFVFLASHSLTNRPSFRQRAEQALGGGRAFTLAYSLLSLALLAWMVAAYRAAPTVLLWDQAGWMRWVPPLVMPLACILAVAGLSSANPFSLGPGAAGFDPSHPGIVRLIRHPVLWAAALWAGAHLVPNGDVAALILFLPLLLLALAGPKMLEAKRKRRLGQAEWARLVEATKRGRLGLGWKPVLGGLALYGALLALHEAVIGVSPLP